jgi:S-adenosylmethionine synthetase
MNIDKLVSEVIPPSDYQHRNGFNNIPTIEKLTENERDLLEKALIEKLQPELGEEIDTLIVDTLAYLKSMVSIPVLKKLLNECNNCVIRLRIATAIFEIDQDVEMVDIAISSVKEMDNKKDAYYVYKLTSAFYYLAKFNNEKANQFIKDYLSHREYLISYNARQALGM